MRVDRSILRVLIPLIVALSGVVRLSGQTIATDTATAEVQWYSYLSGSAQAEAVQLSESLITANDTLNNAQQRLFDALKARKQSLEEQVLDLIRTEGPAAKLSAAMRAQWDALRTDADRYVAGTASIAPGGTSLGSLRQNVDRLLGRRTQILLAQPPDPDTSGYRAVRRALIQTLRSRGIDTETLRAVSAAVDTLAASATDTAAMESYVKESGAQMLRFPRSDDVAGWRFLFSQAIHRQWLTLLTAADNGILATRLETEASLLKSVAPKLSDSMIGAAAAIHQDDHAAGLFRQSLGRYWTDLNAGFMLLVAAQSQSTQNSTSPPAATLTAPSVAGTTAAEIGTFLGEVNALSAPMLSALLRNDLPAASLAAAYSSVLGTISVTDKLQIARAARTDLDTLDATGAVLARSEQQENDIRAAGVSVVIDSGVQAASTAYVARRTAEATKILEEANQTLQDSTASVNRRWAFLGVLENRYAWTKMMTDSRYGKLRSAFSSFLDGLQQNVDGQTVKLLTQNLASSQLSGTPGSSRVVLETISEPAPSLREVAAYEERVASDGTLIRQELPLNTVWASYSVAFYEATQGQTSAPTDPSIPIDWALLHGRAVVHWYWDHGGGSRTLSPSTLMDQSSLRVFLHGERLRYSHMLQSGKAFLENVLEPWVAMGGAASEIGSDAVSGPQSQQAYQSSAVESDRRWERLSVGFLMLRQQIERELLVPIAGYGASPHEYLSDRERYSLSLLDKLASLSISPIEALSELSSLWLGRSMPVPDQAQATLLGTKLIDGFSATADSALTRLSSEARAVTSLHFRQFVRPRAGEDATTYLVRTLRSINSKAASGRLTYGDFLDWRKLIFENAHALIRGTDLSGSEIADLLARLDLVNQVERQALAKAG
ncbi:MAG TPA: hypothetical protein VMW73_15790 [Spirochaetia bacterium]|nr:hypothetical protein [Spirochaetia bacterium]